MRPSEADSRPPQAWSAPASGSPAAAPGSEPVPPAAEPEPEPATSPGARPIAGGWRLRELVWLCVAVVDTFLALDFLLRAAGAVSIGFVAVVDGVGNALAAPFLGVFTSQNVPQFDRSAFWAALVAIVVYTAAAGILIRLLRLLAPPVQTGPRRS